MMRIRWPEAGMIVNGRAVGSASGVEVSEGTA